MLTQERVKQLFDYDPETGLLTRRITVAPSGKAGDLAGFDNGQGYLQITIDYKKYRLHRVIWLLVHGDFPKDQIDHINHDRKDNRLSNLREATDQENRKNRSMPRNNTSGVAGVSWHKRNRRWQAQINVNSEHIYIGSFEDKAGAVAARKSAEIKYGFHENHGK